MGAAYSSNIAWTQAFNQSDYPLHYIKNECLFIFVICFVIKVGLSPLQIPRKRIRQNTSVPSELGFADYLFHKVTSTGNYSMCGRKDSGVCTVLP